RALAGADVSGWAEVQRYVGGIQRLAIGAVAVTTLAVGVAVPLVAPGLPWAACVAVGALVSPPVAGAAQAVLVRGAL
ncbi:Na+/H+ antiporter, partial [Burkholderia pseudomallei]